jgi:hypothetical protein
MIRFSLAIATMLTATLLVLLLAAQGHAHLLAKVNKNDAAWQIEKKQLINLRHTRTAKHRRWHRLAARWIMREHRELEKRTIAPWVPTKNCEAPNAGWWADTGKGFYGGLQFLLSTWRNLGGTQFADYPHHATKIQQVTIAWRHGGDGWPNCPNP